MNALVQNKNIHKVQTSYFNADKSLEKFVARFYFRPNRVRFPYSCFFIHLFVSPCFQTSTISDFIYFIVFFTHSLFHWINALRGFRLPQDLFLFLSTSIFQSLSISVFPHSFVRVYIISFYLIVCLPFFLIFSVSLHFVFSVFVSSNFKVCILSVCLFVYMLTCILFHPVLDRPEKRLNDLSRLKFIVSNFHEDVQGIHYLTYPKFKIGNCRERAVLNALLIAVCW